MYKVLQVNINNTDELSKSYLKDCYDLQNDKTYKSEFQINKKSTILNFSQVSLITLVQQIDGYN